MRERERERGGGWEKKERERELERMPELAAGKSVPSCRFGSGDVLAIRYASCNLV